MWVLYNEHDGWLANKTIDTVVIKVDSIDTININGKNLRRQFVNSYDQYIETIGDLYYFFGTEYESGMCDYPFPTGLRCYTDTFLGEYMAIPSDSCNQIKNYTSRDKHSSKKELKIWPNPSNGIINIENIPISVQKIILQDLFGCTVFELSVKETDNISFKLVESLDNGIYFVRTNSKNRMTIQKFLLLR